ncbi:MAG: Cache 3/Cache 2 fusion domain-containing protein, partial [Deltaproteobacteria bacterium]|nr:Cache 3/Cache 2 fusion domain-containing protein [Deltaproteobacteria bacterium]
MDQFREARTSMIIPAFRDMRIRAKLVSVTLFLIVVSLLSVTYFSVHGFGKALRGAAEEDLEHLVRNVRAMCRLQEEMVENEAMRNLSVAANVIDGMNAFIDSSKEIRFEAVNRFSGEILPLKVPALMLGEVALADNTQVVDRIQKLLGGICSVFQRVEGKGLLRITTTIT